MWCDDASAQCLRAAKTAIIANVIFGYTNFIRFLRGMRHGLKDRCCQNGAAVVC